MLEIRYIRKRDIYCGNRKIDILEIKYIREVETRRIYLKDRLAAILISRGEKKHTQYLGTYGIEK